MYVPQRCPGERFPLILYGHGFSETRASQNSELIDDGNPQPLLDRGYVVIKFDQRGHGENRPPNGGGYARFLDPNAEIKDSRAILDWAYDHAGEIAVQTEPGSGIAKDLRLGTLGGSYGGAFQMLLAALDARVDVIAPDRTFHDTLYSVLAGDALKAFGRLLSIFIQLDELAPGQGVTTTPAVRGFANQVGPLAPTANLVRTRDDLAVALSGPTARPRPVTAQELEDLIYTHSMDYFESQEAAQQPWGFGEKSARLRPVPALFTQGQRDNLFNVTEAYWNARYFGRTGADVRILTHEDGHPNPFAGQSRGQWACGAINAQDSILAWFDHHLKGADSADFRALPKVCISLLGSPSLTAQPVGVILQEFPVGSLSGTGAVPAKMPTLSVAVPIGRGTTPVFVPVATIDGNDKVLAGIPRVGKITVSPGLGSLQTAIAIIGVGIRRGGELRLVDEQVTGFVAGEHDGNRGVRHPGEKVFLPGVGARLEDGDEVGLLFYEQHVQYAPVVSGQNIAGITAITSLIPGGPQFPPLLSALDPVTGLIAVPNPYEVVAEDVELPILVPGRYPGSSLSR